MTQNAVVIKLEADGWAEVEARRLPACGHDCARCGGGCGGAARVLARNPVGARAGDEVVLESPSRPILGFAAAVYLLPLLLFFTGCFAAIGLGAGEGLALAAGGVCFALSAAGAVLAGRRASKRRREWFRIVSIVPG